MKEEKYIQSLFEKARQEEPQLSYEEASHNLDVAINPGKVAILRDWFFNHIYLNTFIAILSIFVLSGFMFFNTQTNEKTIAAASLISTDNSTNSTQDKSRIAVIEKEQIQPEENIELPSEESISKELETKIKSENVQIKKVTTPSPITTMQASSEDQNIVPAKFKSTPSQVIPEEIKSQKPSKTISQTIDKPVKKTKAFPEEIASRQDNRSELEIVLETALNTEKLKNELFIKNRLGDFQQLIIKTNNKFDNLIDVYFAGKKAIMLKSGYDGSFNIVDDEFVDIQSLKIEDEKAILEFIYNSELIQVELEKIDGQWVHKYTGKSYAQEDHFVRQELMQMLFDNENMSKLIEKNKNGDSKSFKLLSNGLLSDHLQINFAGKDLEIVSYPNSLRESYVKITKFQVRKKKAIVEFIYQSKTHEVNFRNKNGEWTLRSFKQL